MGQLGGLSPEGSIAIGILVGLLSTSVQSLGLTLQRKSHILEDEKVQHDDDRRPPYRRRRWQLGMGMFIIANLLGSTIQITTLPLPVLSTLQASGLVFNSICATLLLAEPFTAWSFGGTFLVCTGAVLIAIFGAIPEPAHNLDQLLDLLNRRPFVLWMIGQAVIVVAIICVATCLARFPDMASNPRLRLVRGFAYGAISGILSAHSLLVAKSAVELLVRTIVDGVNQFTHWQAWVILGGLVFLALTQLYYLHLGLKLVSTSVLYPLVFCIYNIVAILDGLIYFRQTDQLSLLHGLLIALGTVILLAGVLALSWQLNDEQTPAPVTTALAPGLGFVEDTDDEYDDSSSPEEQGEEDEGEEEAEDSRSQNARLLRGKSMTPTTKPHLVPDATGRVRTSSRVVGRNEIWGQSQDEDGTRTLSQASRANTLPPVTHRAESRQSNADEPTEATALLRSLTEQQQRKRRRRSTGKGFPGFQARPSPRSTRRISLVSSRNTLRGFLRLRWGKDNGGSVDSGNIARPSDTITSSNIV